MKGGIFLISFVVVLIFVTKCSGLFGGGCIWRGWSSWSSCSRSCGGGRQSRRRTSVLCPSKTEGRYCNTHCCPVNCKWSQWDKVWGACSKTCGRGIKYRFRSIESPKSCGGTCPGSSSDYQFCNDVCCPVNCQWNVWGSWESCTATCGGGISTRRRSIAISGSCGGVQCQGPHNETRQCNAQCCLVDCEMHDWSSWFPCSSFCGPSGIKKRNRYVSVHSSCGGRSCPAEREQLEPCNRLCLNNGTIVNSTCLCTAGWTGHCCQEDVNECLSLLHGCHQNATCTNTIGSYGCDCDTGFSGNGKQCKNYDECSLNVHKCDSNANCIDMDGSYDCECKSGYVGDGFLCTDLNECLLNSCGDNMECFNYPGSFKCFCKDGFQIEDCEKKSGINETSPCSETAVKIPEMKSFGNQTSKSTKAKSCKDVNECLLDPCGENMVCSNYPGSFNCSCKDGFEMEDCDEGSEINKTSPCAEFRFSKNEGSEKNAQVSCTDIDECKNPNSCSDRFMLCQNTPGSYQCYCVEPMIMKNEQCEKNIDAEKATKEQEFTSPWQLPVISVLACLLVVLVTILIIRIYRCVISKRHSPMEAYIVEISAVKT